MQASVGSKIALCVVAAICRFANTASAQPPIEITNSIGMKLVLIPRGTFVMGNSDPEIKNSLPPRKVTISRDFYLGSCEVTQQQYETVMGVNPSYFQVDITVEKSEDLPVERLTWHDAVEFCLRLSEMPEERKHKRFYRLPSEAEWEYACRAGTSTKYFFGDDDAAYGEYAWYVNNSGDKPLDFEALWKKDDVGATIQAIKNKWRTHPVGIKKPNPWGLFDIYGNVEEWCWDSYDEEDNELDDQLSYEVSDPINPGRGVTRGGAFRSSCRKEGYSAYRFTVLDSWKSACLGFRVAMVTADPRNDTTADNDDPPER